MPKRLRVLKKAVPLQRNSEMKRVADEKAFS